MTLNELIAMLMAQVENNPESGDYQVHLEGCDCSGPAGDIHVNDEFRYVEILRVDD